jgi:hypothetical protein
MTTPALPGLEPGPTYNLTQPRQTRQPNPYQHLTNPTPRGIRATWCRNCRTPIITGPDADYCAAIINADTQPLTPLGEILATLNNHTTYTLRTPFGQSARLTRRTASEIRRFPADNPQRPWHQYDVLTEHQCQNPTPTSLTTTSRLAYTPPKRIDHNEPAPF